MVSCNYKKKLEIKVLWKDKNSMKNIQDLEKKINSELTTKIKESKVLHNQLYLSIIPEDLLDVVTLIKTNKDTKFKQLIDITAVDYPQREKRFKIVYLLLSHEKN